jgi:large repetitive protein
MGMQAIGRWLGEPKKVALLLLAAGLAAVAALGLAAAPASADTFSNNSGITINSGSETCFGAAATPYPSTIEVTTFPAGSSITDVNVTVSGLSHQWPDDIGLLLVSPAGQSVILMSDSGGDSNTSVSGITLTFDDLASGPVPDSTALVSGTSYQPSRGTSGAADCDVPASFPAPAPMNTAESPYGSSLSVFNDSDPNGNWQLYVIDDAGAQVGSITGWSLDISTTTVEDTTPPTVTAKTPAPPPDPPLLNKSGNVTATFSEEVQNVTTDTFILERNIAVKKTDPPKYVLVDATVDLINGVYVLNPLEDLPKGTYRATIKTAVTDEAGNALEDPEVWTFKVAKNRA